MDVPVGVVWGWIDQDQLNRHQHTESFIALSQGRPTDNVAEIIAMLNGSKRVECRPFECLDGYRW